MPDLPHLASYEVAVRLETLALVPRFLRLYPEWHAAQQVFPLLQELWYGYQRDLRAQKYCTLDQSLGASCALALVLLPFIEPGQIVSIPTLVEESQVTRRDFLILEQVKVLQPFTFTPHQVCGRSLAVPTQLWAPAARHCHWCLHKKPHTGRFYQHAETFVQVISPEPEPDATVRTWLLRQEFVLEQDLHRPHDHQSLRFLVSHPWWQFRFFLLAGAQALMLNAQRIWETQCYLHKSHVITFTDLPLFQLLQDFLLPTWFTLTL